MPVTSHVLHGDCRDVLATLDPDSIDAVVTDPPYHLTSIVRRFGSPTAAPAKVGKTGAYARAARGFMGKTWDGGDVAQDPATWAAVARVMKPGAHLMAFSGTRTYHRMACAIEDAGFEIRDQIGWAYGQGFPKSHFVGDGWGTALKPAWEPIVVARKRMSERTVAANVARWGTGAINIGACRVGSDQRENGPASITSMQRKSRVEAGYRHDDGEGPGAPASTVIGRWPANLIHDGSQGVLELFPDSKGQLAAVGPQNGAKISVNAFGNYGPRVDFQPRGDSGSAARFFYCAKASASDRAGSKHPTVKPRALMRYLCRLVTPLGGTVLDPFAGSGTTLYAAQEEGFGAIGIELDPEYFAFIEARLAPRLEAAE